MAELSEIDILRNRAASRLRGRISQALELAEKDLCNFLRTTRAAGTDHAYDCAAFARALIFDQVCGQTRPVYSTSGAINPRQCPTVEEIAGKMALRAADAALAALDAVVGNTDHADGLHPGACEPPREPCDKGKFCQQDKGHKRDCDDIPH